MTSLDREALARAFVGKVEPVPVTMRYRLGLVVVTLVTLLLPVLYLGVVAAVAYGVYWHAVNDVWILSERHSLSGLILYLGPLIVGAILFFFMWKPILARPQRVHGGIVVTSADVPLIFELVEQIRTQLGAPAPSEIRLDAEVNASASFRRGLLSALSRGDLVLTIGMPLVTGLTVRQLAGILAHELGHFAQGSSMRLTHLIRSINAWLARVATERDHWDAKLDEAYEKAPGQFRLIFLVAKLSVWLTRQLLALLTLAGHAIGTFMLREMELDADRYEARLAGSDVFASTIEQMKVLAMSRLKAGMVSTDPRRGGVGFCADLPALTAALAERLDPATRESFAAEPEATSSSRLDTHPPNARRIANAAAENAAGVFRLEAPAAALLGPESSSVSRQVSLAAYAQNDDGAIADEQLLALPAFLALYDTRGAQAAAADRVFGGVVDLLHPLTDDAPLTPREQEDAVATLAVAREALAAFRSERDAPEAEPPDETRIEPARRAAAERLRLARFLLASSPVRERISEAAAMEDELTRNRGLLEALAGQGAAIEEVAEARAGLLSCWRQLSVNGRSEQVAAQLTLAQARLHRQLDEIERRLAAIPNTFEPDPSVATLADHLPVGAPAIDDPALAAFLRAGSVMGQLRSLEGRALGRLAVAIEQVEAVALDASGAAGEANGGLGGEPVSAER